MLRSNGGVMQGHIWRCELTSAPRYQNFLSKDPEVKKSNQNIITQS